MKDSKDFIGEFIRQIEILALCINGDNLSKADLAGIYNVSEITINRDLQSLRNKGIQIFSRKKAVRLIAEPPGDILIKLTSDYLPLKLNFEIFNDQVKVFAKNTTSVKYFPTLTLLSKAVHEGIVIRINYTRMYDDESKDYQIKPLRLNTRGFNWIIDGFDLEELKEKSFYVNSINKVVLTGEHFDILPDHDQSQEKKKIILRFNPEVENQIYNKIFFDDYKLHKSNDGFIMLTTNQIITHRLAAWCI
ncbi:MAG: WYL domain-containing protein, partial [Bacteroidota bacterium]|nr:WYL domain-containing protein [Bacteroidota bacterium]MDP4197180.1 WYL domain-containing protein [Bacteroidota bacterium]